LRHQLLDGVEWVLFDAVGTLIFPDPPVAEAYHAAGQKFGSQLSVGEIRRRFRAALSATQACGERTSESRERDRWRKIVHSVLDDVTNGSEALFESLWHHFAQPQHWRAFDDVAVLDELLARGYRIGVASNFDDRLIPIANAHLSVATRDAIFVSSNVGYTKPDRRFFRTIEEKLGVNPTQIALVGDDEVADVRGATEAGWKAIRLDRSGSIVSADTIRSLAGLL
jgi:putative hydrolase of the HAD superfamily